MSGTCFISGLEREESPLVLPIPPPRESPLVLATPRPKMAGAPSDVPPPDVPVRGMGASGDRLAELGAQNENSRARMASTVFAPAAAVALTSLVCGGAA